MNLDSHAEEGNIQREIVEEKPSGEKQRGSNQDWLSDLGDCRGRQRLALLLSDSLRPHQLLPGKIGVGNRPDG